MDESPVSEVDQQADIRTGVERRLPSERRNGGNRLLERFARLEGTETDRRRGKRRNQERASRLSFLWRWAKG